MALRCSCRAHLQIPQRRVDHVAHVDGVVDPVALARVLRSPQCLSDHVAPLVSYGMKGRSSECEMAANAYNGSPHLEGARDL